jgi:hypothetical protein
MRKLVLLVGIAVLSATMALGAPVDKKAINAVIERGVAALKRAQRDDGSWHNSDLGATALCALALVECEVPKTDPCIKSAAEYVRKHGLTTTHVYSLALCILFLDRLDVPSDTPLIESMIVRLLAGQNKSGNWSYNTPAIADLEMKRITSEMDGTRVLRAGGDLKKMPPRGKRTVKDLPEAVQQQLKVIAAGGGGAVGPAGAFGGDNSNTQFAVLALWTGRRYGVPTQEALVRAYDHFRTSQNADGGWAYTGGGGTAGGSSATMTCAGVLGLAVGHGAAVDIKKAKKADAKDSADVSKDIGLQAGLAALGASIGVPLGWDGTGGRPAAVPSASGRSFYFLWSLERIAIALNLATIGKKDWYNWGAEILIANQGADGTWTGDYASYHADTCFALLFLKRSNLASDLGEKIVGLKDPGERKLKAGGPLTLSKGGSGPEGPGIGEKGKTPVTPKATPEKTGRPKLDEPARSPEERTARELGKSLLTARDERRREILEKLRDTRGVEYTETLAYTIPELEGEAKREARLALTARLARMKDVTLADYLTDDDAEIRRAAALASGTKEVKAHVPALVKMLRDREDQVRRAAHAALKATTGQKFDLDPAAWEKWLRETRRE